jgi:hypothetical protein
VGVQIGSVVSHSFFLPPIVSQNFKPLILWHHLGTRLLCVMKTGGSMILKMILEGQLIGFVEVERHKVKTTGYLVGLQQFLQKKYYALLLKKSRQPMFVLEIPTENG